MKNLLKAWRRTITSEKEEDAEHKHEATHKWRFNSSENENKSRPDRKWRHIELKCCHNSSFNEATSGIVSERLRKVIN